MEPSRTKSSVRANMGIVEAMAMHLYKLLGKLPVPIDDVLEWGQWFEDADRRVARDEIGDYTVSTVFLGLDHSMGGAEPQLFETMVFKGTESTWCESGLSEARRCATWDQALEQHATMVDRVKGELAKGT